MQDFKRIQMKQLGLVILLFVCSLAFSQNVEFKASAPSVVAVGEEFRLSYTLNKEGSNLQLPSLEGFDLLMGPSTSQSFMSSTVNDERPKVCLILILLYWRE